MTLYYTFRWRTGIRIYKKKKERSERGMKHGKMRGILQNGWHLCPSSIFNTNNE